MEQRTLHEVRITTGGRISAWVDFALEHLKKTEDGAIAFHTLPAVPTSDGTTPQPAKDRSCETIPKLISVVEVVKRFYISSLKPTLGEDALGLHQYNFVGCSEEVGQASDGRQTELVLALDGKNYPRIHKVPYMRVILSRKALPDGSSSGMTYQRPPVKRLTKSAKSRLKRRIRKATISA